MPNLIAKPILAGLAVLLLIAGCGGGGDDGGGDGNNAPVAHAGAAQTVLGGAVVTLNGSGSSDSDGSIASYAWTQSSGTTVVLSSSGAAQPTFTAPAVGSTATLVFSLVVTDNEGASSTAASVTITVNPAAAGPVTVSGTVRFQRVPFGAASSDGLNYAAPVLQPARGVVVHALDATSSVVLATGATDAAGAYSLNVPGNTNMVLQVVARMQRGASAGQPSWNVRVQDGTSTNATPYTYNSATFNSSVGTQNVDMPTGIAANGGSLIGPRASGSFAILDTIYSAIQLVLSAAPATNFPELYVNWGNAADGTYFTTANGQHLTLLNGLSADTDEFDQHVVAHEFGHYVEYNFSRSDSIGGPHTLGDRLDMRVAFGEGFGYAFAAMVLNDPVVKDSFNSGGAQLAGNFNVESNPGGGAGCWCSETSVWAILWDLFDSNNEGADSISLGFQPLWELLTGPQRVTPAFTSIFTFVTALKAAQPAQSAAIDALVSPQNINSAGIDAWATNETNGPAALLPLYATITAGAAVPLASVNDYGPVTNPPGDTNYTFNKAGSRRFLRYVPATAATNISLSTSNSSASPDPDFLVYRLGDVVGFEVDPPGNPEVTESPLNLTVGDTYVVEVYDCANGCTTVQGTTGDFTLTTAVN